MCFGDFLLLALMWGVSIFVWTNAGIDYIVLLKLEHTDIGRSALSSLAAMTHISEHRHEAHKIVFESVANSAVVLLVVFILFNKALRASVGKVGDLAAAHVLPVGVIGYFLYKIFSPYESSRQDWLMTLWRVLAAPFYGVIFRDGYVGDLLTSLVRVMIPLCFSLTYFLMTAYCWVSNDMACVSSTSDHWWKDSVFFKFILLPIVTLFPLWLRLLQCVRRSVESGKRWPHIGNALKYCSAMIVIAYGTFQPSLRDDSVTWVAGFVFATLFQFCWDLTQDWGMIVFKTPETAYNIVDYVLNTEINLRSNRLLGGPCTYYSTMVFNLILRFAWTLTLLPRWNASVAASSGGDGDSNNSAAVSSMADAAAIAHHAGESGFSIANSMSLLSHIGPLIAAAEIVRRMVWGFFRLEHEQLEQRAATERAYNQSTVAARQIAELSNRREKADADATTISNIESGAMTSEKFRSDDNDGFEKVGWIAVCNCCNQWFFVLF
jgi:hypothetical protein